MIGNDEHEMLVEYSEMTAFNFNSIGQPKHVRI